jgi:5'-3' exonuclease
MGRAITSVPDKKYTGCDVIIDCSHLCYRAMFSLNGLEYEDKQTGVIFGFMKDMIKLAEKFRPKRFIFCWDSQKSFRKLEYPQYKEQRKKNIKPEHMEIRNIGFPQFKTLRDFVLPCLGFRNNYMQTGLEADDLIARVLIDNYVLSEEKPVVVSADNDLYQLLDRCHLYSAHLDHTYTADEFTTKWGVEPMQWAYVKAIAGCSTDGVDGVDGVAEIKAAQFLTGIMRPTTNTYNAIKAFQNNGGFHHNLTLVQLPHMKTHPIKLDAKEALVKGNFIEIFQRYGFTSQMKKESFGKWVKFMELN